MRVPSHAERVTAVKTTITFMVHPTIRNKPEPFQPEYSRNWKEVVGPLEELKHHVGNGGAFIGVRMVSDHRSSSAFDYADLAVVDIDYGLTIEEFKKHPLCASACWGYTTASHGVEGDRYRVVFRLPHRITNPDVFKGVVSLLIKALGSDRACSDACRLFYGNDKAQHFIWDPDAVLPESILDDAEQEARNMHKRESIRTDSYDEVTFEQAIFVLENVLEPTRDGDRERFTRITSAARSGGDRLFPHWSDWASRGHHGKGKNRRQTTERFFYGFNGSSLATLFFMANEEDPDWRDKLPAEIRSSGTGANNSHYGSAVGYDWEDFLGDPDQDFAGMTREDSGNTQSLFDEARPWTQVAQVQRPQAEEPELYDDEYEDPPEAETPVPEDETVDIPRIRNHGRQRGDAEVQIVVEIKNRLQNLYPGLRLNSMSQSLEYGPIEKPIPVDDVSTSYVRISAGAGQVFPKTLTYDTALIVGREHAYHPVRAYLEKCAAETDPCPYFDTLATELLGVAEDTMTDVVMPDGSRLCDVILKRFMIGAVARVLEPGCVHDWMPILIGGQNAGKSTFFQYLTPPAPEAPGYYPWVSTVQQGINYLKDRPHVLHCGFIVLLDECDRYFKRQSVEEFKNLVSVGTDRSAKKYENERDFRRSFVLAGATNSNEFLVDPTGNRRFMPIVVDGKIPSKDDPNIKIIDLDRLKKDRDSIWAAAYKAYLDNPVHTFTSYEISFVSEYMENFQQDSPLEYMVLSKFKEKISGEHVFPDKGLRNYWLMADIFEWLDVHAKEERSMTRQISDALKRRGFYRRRVRKNNRIMNMWVTDDPYYDSNARELSRDWN